MPKTSVTKTVNRTGKKLVKKALVVKEKKAVKVGKEEIKKANEKMLSKKIKKAESVVGKVEATSMPRQAQDSGMPKEKKYSLTIGLKEMLAAGCHLGHKVAKTHPKAKVNIYTAKDGIQILDLTKSRTMLEKACNFLHSAKKNGKQIVMVGTKRQAREVVRRVAMEVGVGYVTDRWLGGMVSNWDQIKKTAKRLEEIRDGFAKDKFGALSKKEQSELNKEATRLEKMVGGVVGLEKLFDVLVIVDAGFEKTAVREAGMRGLTTVALVDTDSDPGQVDYAIPVNDDSVKSVNLIVEEIGRAIKAA